MSFITSNQGRPIQGISQQPEKTRLPGQCTLSDNLRPDVVRGLVNRQGTKASATLLTALQSVATKWHYYSRGTGEAYFISVEQHSGKVRAWSANGLEHIVNVQNNAEVSYLASAQPKVDLTLQTIGDYTFLANNTKMVMASSVLSPNLDYKAIINVQYMTYSQHQTVYINGILSAWWNSGPGGDTGDSPGVAIDYVAGRLLAGLQGTSGSAYGGSWGGVDVTAEYDFYQVSNTVVIKRKDAQDFNIFIDDAADNKNAVAIKGKLETTTLLPGKAPEGFLVEIDPPGASTIANSSYFLKAVNSSSDHVTWSEALSPSISVGPDRATMPHVLVRESINSETGVATFTLRQGEWSDREVGSDTTNPNPTYTGKKIQSIGLFQNRMFFTAGESVIMSRSSEFFNFYRETAQASLDTDPIDVFADVPEVNYLTSNVNFDGDLVFFSNSGQFLMDGSKPITASNATLRQTTSFEADLSVDPVASGDSIMFAFQYGLFTGVREFFTDSITDTKKARPVTDHIKQYIAGTPQIMKTSTNLNLLLIKTDAADNVLYTYDWLWQGAEKVQSAWSRLVFPATDRILHFEFAENLLYLVMWRDNATITIEVVDMGDPNHGVLGFPVRLDRRMDRTFYWDLAGGCYSMQDPFPNVAVEEIVMLRGTGAYAEEVGTPIDFYREGAYLKSKEELREVASPVEVVMGIKYLCIYSPTNPVALDENGYALNLDRLTIGAFYLNYNTTGDVYALVKSKNGTSRTYSYNNRTLGGAENLIGFAPLVEGQHRTPIRQKADQYSLTYYTNSHLPLEIRDFEYNGNMNRRGRRI